MYAQQIGVVLCRVGAAVLIVQAIQALGYSLPGLLFGYDDLGPEVLWFTLLAIAPGLAAIGLWVFADRISRIAARDEPVDNPRPVDGVDLVRIGTALIGIYLLVTALLDGVHVEVTNLALPDIGADRQSFTDEHVARTIGRRVSNATRLLLGIALIVGRNRIAEMLAKARYLGTNRIT